ncbi:MAG: hypothetical protein ACKO2V_10130 [Snowella sp.]
MLVYSNIPSHRHLRKIAIASLSLFSSLIYHEGKPREKGARENMLQNLKL